MTDHLVQGSPVSGQPRQRPAASGGRVAGIDSRRTLRVKHQVSAAARISG